MVDDDKTQVLTEGTENYPLDATLAANPEPCPNCQTEIPAANQFCSKCGYQRGTWDALDSSDDEQTGEEESAQTALWYLVNEQGSIGIPEGESIIGRGNVDLKVNDGYLSRQHAKFEASPDSLTVTDLGSANGSFVGEDKLEPNQVVDLTTSVSLKLGQTVYSVERAEVGDIEPDDDIEQPEPSDEPIVPEINETTEDPLPEESSTLASSPWSLEYGEGEIIQLQLGETTVGRSNTKCDVTISGDGFISSLHLIVTTTVESVEVEDLGSTNGTKHNGERLQANAPVALAKGDNLQIGETNCVVAFCEPDTQADKSDVEEVDQAVCD